MEAERRQHGIPVVDSVVQELLVLCAQFGITL
jgi:LDH2 family malate/lactate/ureidoglycolate dehydrogenase